MIANTQQRANPFPGLRPFRADEHHLFFGREDQTAALLQLLRQNRFLAVVGTSGSGKSSLVRAGMIAELYGGTMNQAGSTWEVILLRPGGSPIENLARAMVDAELYDAKDPETLPRLLATLRRSRFGLVEAIKQSDVFEPGANLLVVVDQFEELFRFRQQGVGSEEAAAAFVNLLLTASEQAECPIYVTLTMRSDYLGDCSEIPGLAEAVNEGEYLIPRLLRDQKRDAIEKPIGVGGAKISPLLVQRLLNDVGDDPDQLPVLQHALMRMWDVWSTGSDHDRPIEFCDFEATGGLAAALSNHADEIFAALPDELHRTVCERVFKTLTEKGADNRGIRRPTRLSQLEAIAGADRVTMTAVLDAYRRSGVTFVMPGTEHGLQDRTVLDLSHESLMRGWQRLRSWVEDEAQSARIFRRLSDTASLWQNGKAGLFRDPDLQIALSWREQQQPSREWAEQYGGQFQAAVDFLDASNADAEAEHQAKEAARRHELEQARQLAEARQLQLEQQRRSGRKLRKLIAGLAVVAVFAGCACVAALIANNNANRLAQRADQEADKANRNAQQAERAGQEARRAEQAARAAEEAGRKLLYTTDMRLAPFVWSDDRSTAEQLRSLLAKHNPNAKADENNDSLHNGEKPDLRGFEWRYYQHLLDSNAAVFSGHGSSVIDGAFTADGQLVTLDQHGQARRWNLDLQDEVEASRRDLPNGRDAQVRVLSPDGRLAALAEGKQVHVLDMTTGQENFQVDSAYDRFRRLIFSPDSERLVIVDDKIRWCDAGSGQVIATFDQKFSRGASLALSADGLTLAVVGHGRVLNLFSVFRLNPSDGNVTPLGKDIDPGITLSAAALIPDGTLIAVGAMYSGPVTMFDTATGRLISKHGSAHASPVTAIAFSRDGLKLATADNEGTIKIWEDARKLNSKSAASITLKGHQERINTLGFSSDDKQLVSTSADKTARVWDTANAGATIRRLERSGVDCVVARFSPDGQLIAAADGSSVRLWDAATGQLVRELSAGDNSRVSSVAFSPTDSRLLAVGHGGQADVSHVALWDIDAGMEVGRLPGATDLPDFSVTDVSGWVGALAFSPDGKRLVAGFGAPNRLDLPNSPHPLKVWEVATRRLIRRLNGHTGYCVSLDFSRDGKQLASGSFDGTAIIWSTETWKATQTLRNPDPGSFSSQARGMVDEVAFSPDGKNLAMASREGNLLLWDVATGQLLETLKGHSSAVSAVVFSPDGRTLASGSSDQTVRLWNVDTRQELMQLDSGNVEVGIVYTLAFSPDGKQLLAGGRVSTAFWSTAPIVWNDAERAAAKLQLLLDSNADFQSRIRMLSENLRLHEALEKLDAKDVRVQAALAATRANWHASQQRWAEAAEEFDRLRELSPDAPQAWLRTPGLIRVARALAERGKPAVAARLLTGGVQRRIADGAVSDPATDEQITSLQAAINQRLTDHPRHVGLLELRAELAGQLSRWSEQVADSTVAIEALSELPQDEAAEDLTRLYRRRGDAHVALNHWQLAVDDYDHFVTAEARDPELLSKRARAYEELHDWQAAANDWTRALAANPGGATLHVEFARRLAHSGQLELAAGEREQARRLYELALQADPYSPIIAEQLAQLKFEMSEPKWTVLKPTEMRSEGGATLTKLDDNSILASGKNSNGDVYTIVTEVNATRVSAIRLEALTDESLPNRGPGRTEPWGSFAMVYWQITSRSASAEAVAIPLSEATADYSHPNFPVHVTNWNIGGGPSRPHTAVFLTQQPIDLGQDSRLNFWMKFSANAEWPLQNLGRFRLSVSDDAQAVRHARIRLAAMKFTDPWAKLAAAYHLLGDEAGLEGLLMLHPAAAAAIGDLYAAQKDWEPAIAEYTQLITADTTDAAALAKRAAAYVATEQWDLAMADWTRAIQRQSDLAQSAFVRWKQAGRWSEAAKFGLMLVEQKPDDSLVWLGVAPVLVLAGDEADYPEFCRRMVRQFGEAPDFRNAENTCKACLLRPDTIDLARLSGNTLAKALDDGTSTAWSQFLIYRWGSRALLAYRSGDAASAVTYVTKSEELNPVEFAHAFNLAVRSLAQHQLGQQEEARSDLDQASQLVNRLQRFANNQGHQDLLIAQILLREAETKINGQAKPKPADAALLQSAFDSFGKAGRWKEAAEVGLRLVDQTPDDAWLSLRVAPILVLAGDAAGYRDFSVRVAKQFGDTTDALQSSQAIKACLLRANSIDLSELPRDALARSLDDGTTPAGYAPWHWGTRALLAYRSGDAESAVKYVTQSEELKPTDIAHAINLAVLALAQHHLGQLAEARRTLKGASEHIDRLHQDPQNQGDTNLLVSQILLHEAETLINADPKPADAAAKPRI